MLIHKLICGILNQSFIFMAACFFGKMQSTSNLFLQVLAIEQWLSLGFALHFNIETATIMFVIAHDW